MKKGLYLGAVIGALLCPMQVAAAGQDAVNLSQEGPKVAVSLEMSNAEEEKITAVSLSLQVDAPGQAEIGFEFSPALENVESGFIYKEDTGRLDIYAASAQNLFDGGTLGLGYVSVTPADAAQLMEVEVSYCQNSFQTANGSYGDKTPVVEREPEPITMKVGNGAVYPTEPGEGNPDTGGQGPDTGIFPDEGGQNPGDAGQEGSPGNGNQGGNPGGGNINDGLYDENTQFKNDPSDAQNIPSSVIQKDGQTSSLVDMSQGAAAQMTGKPASGTGAKVRPKRGGKVSVVDPGKGPSGILIAKTESGNGSQMLEGSSGGPSEGVLDAAENGTESILLDQENGGAVDDHKKGMKIDSKILLAAGIAVVTVIAVLTLILLLKGDGRERRKRRKHKKKKHTKNSGKKKGRK